MKDYRDRYVLAHDGGTEEVVAGGSETEVEDISKDLVFKAGNTEYDVSTPEGRAALQRDLDAQIQGLSAKGQEVAFLKEQNADLIQQVKGGQKVREDMEEKGATEDEIAEAIRERGFVTQEQADKRAAEIAQEIIAANKSADALNSVLDTCEKDKENYPGFNAMAVMQRLKDMGIEYHPQLGKDVKTVQRRVDLAYQDLMKEAEDRKPDKDEEARPRSRVFQERPGVGQSRLKPPPAKHPGLDDDGFASYLGEQLPDRD